MKRKVLIVDDEPDVNLSLKMVLEEKSFEVDTFDNPLSALEDFRKGLYDLLILDVKMPNMNGFQLYRKIKKIDDKAKVCFLTAGEMCDGAYADIFNELNFILITRKQY